MRIKGEKKDIDYNDTRDFFKRRAQKYNADNPYSVTMYQDNNAELVQKRNQYETEKLIGLLDIDESSHVLDLACGVGRWADALNGRIGSYTGIDFSNELIDIARSRNTDRRVSFLNASMTEIDAVLEEDRTFNRVLIVGALMYLNDEDVLDAMKQLERHCDARTLICIREPLGIESRLTLKDFYSDELNDRYNAIYRTRDELMTLISPSLFDKGFSVLHEGFLFDDAGLNNRAETAQYYYILKR